MDMASMKNQFLLVILLAALSVMASKYEIELQSFEVLPSLTDKDTIDPKTLRLKQSHRNSFVISGDFEIKQNFAKDDKAQIEYHQRFQTGNYILVASYKLPLCELTKFPFYNKVLEVSNLPPSSTCPFPKGNYSINNLILDESFFPPILPTGDNYVLFKALANGRPVYGQTVKTHIKKV